MVPRALNCYSNEVITDISLINTDIMQIIAKAKYSSAVQCILETVECYISTSFGASISLF